MKKGQKKCKYCGRFFHSKGLTRHMQHCIMHMEVIPESVHEVELDGNAQKRKPEWKDKYRALHLEHSAKKGFTCCGKNLRLRRYLRSTPFVTEADCQLCLRTAEAIQQQEVQRFWTTITASLRKR